MDLRLWTHCCLSMINCAPAIWFPGTVSVLTSLSSVSTLCSVLRSFLWGSQCFLRVTILIISLLDQTSTSRYMQFLTMLLLKVIQLSLASALVPTMQLSFVHANTHPFQHLYTMYAMQSTTNSTHAISTFGLVRLTPTML